MKNRNKNRVYTKAVLRMLLKKHTNEMYMVPHISAMPTVFKWHLEEKCKQAMRI